MGNMEMNERRGDVLMVDCELRCVFKIWFLSKMKQKYCYYPHLDSIVNRL